ncbi:MAG: hypothetical protein IH591_11670, partial [Bacteroidales bacterium]|nr:hypothetical protein [Bacteroidales bacterium]
TGAVSSDWAIAGNWTAGVPGSWNLISIPSSQNDPLLSGSLTIGSTASLTIEAGGALTVTGDLSNNGPVTIGSTLLSSGSLIVNGTVTGDITYNRQLKTGTVAGSDFHLVAPPVASNAEANTGKISSVNQWAELTGIWSTTNITSALPGHGYNIRQEDASDGMISFTGPLVNTDVTVSASSPYADAIGPDDSYFDRTFSADRSLTNLGGNGWNLLGNPYPSAISASAFIDANYSATPSLSQFDPNYVALYLFDGTARRYYYLANSTGWPSGLDLSGTHVQAGQGFFVLAMNDNSEFMFTRTMQEHSTGTAMLKSGSADNRWPGLQLKMQCENGEVFTTVVYGESMSTGVDPGYDIGLFRSGQGIDLYTKLALRDNGVFYTRQALPSAWADTIVVPVGVDYEKGGDVVFSAVTAPVGNRRFWLEDRAKGIFTELGLKSYSVSLPANTLGTGRFYLVASSNTPTQALSTEGQSGLQIWAASGKVVVRGMVYEGAVCEIIALNGGTIAEVQLSGGQLNTVDLPSDIHGIYIVRIIDRSGVTTRKVLIP